MPTYTYECEKCGHQFDYFHSIKAEPKVICGKCKGKCHRLIGTGAGIIFKGSGFYETDYKKKGNNGNSSHHKATTDGNEKSSMESKTTNSNSKEATSSTKTS